MNKILSPIINLISLILVGAAFGLGGLTAAHNAHDASIGAYYQLVWWNPTALSLVGFFALCVGAFLLLVVFLPKSRKLFAPVAGLFLILAGVLALLTPKSVARGATVTNQPGLIALAVLLFVAGAFSLVVCTLEFLSKEDK